VDLDASGADDGLSIDDFSLTPNGGPVTPTVNIGDVAAAEGNSGTTSFVFAVTLTQPAGAGGVVVTYSTQDNTATTADNDYQPVINGSLTIPETSSSGNTTILVTGDLNVEPNESFFVNITNATGATIGDSQGTGTINNDDVVITPIHDIQGPGASSPLVGDTVSTTGIVTGIKSNGFFIQAPDAGIDADANTSEGIFVFTSSAPPAAAARGNSVLVTGTVQEFIPSADPFSPPITELGGSPSVVLQSTGNPLPAAVTIEDSDTLVNDLNNLEKFEGMRVSVASLTVVGPTQGNTSEPNATGTSNGIFYGVITGVPRPFREPGIQVPDPLPMGAPPGIPRFDGNPERLRVDSDGQVGGALIDVTSGATVTGLVGPLDYSFRTYTILPDPSPAPQPVVSGNASAEPVPVPLPGEFTVASFNMERFFDTVNDPGIGEPVLTPTAFNNRLNKASLAIRNVMRMPDVIGVEEIENLTTLQAIATKLNNDEVAAGHPSPMYQGFLEEGNDPGGIDVGLLVKTARVTVIDVVQVGKDETFTDPNNGQQAILNDRPSLVLRATMTGPPGTSSVAFTVIVNHLRSLLGIDDPLDGNRVRTKRRAQAEFLAKFIQGIQTSDPNARVVSVGDYNAFQFNDGYVDVIGTVKGTPTAASEVVLASQDLVNPDLIDLFDQLPADQRYSFVFDGNAQVLDHELLNGKMFELFSHISYARNDSDFPEAFRSDPNRPERLSDHDMPVVYFNFPPASADLSISKTTGAGPFVTGADLTYTITLTNGGPDPAMSVVVTDAIPANTTFKSVSTPAGWTPSTPVVGSGGTVTWANASLSPGSATFQLTVTLACATADGTSIANEARVDSDTADPDSEDRSATATISASNPAPTIACPSNLTVPAAAGQCSAVVSFTISASDNCPGVVVVSSPASGSTFPKGTTTVTSTATDSAGRTASCTFTVTVQDQQPPTITCPPDKIVTAAKPGDLTVPVTFASPTIGDNCPGATVACVPPSGSAFPLGTTTVTCTATDTSGNTATCSFIVTTFDVCLKNDGGGATLLFNSVSGQFIFCCDGITLSGTATATRHGCTISLLRLGPSYRIQATVNACNKSGTAMLQVPPGRPRCQIVDRDISNNVCSCTGG
jgi:uncharacterized repeat protein (TIGR01451 family)